MTKSKTIFYQAQEAVVSALSQDEVLSGRVPFVSENQLDIDFQIKNALGKQGIVGVVMTPQATYQGTYQGQDQVWDLKDFTVQVVENPIVNRTLSASRDPMTAFDAVTRATEVLASPLSPVWGQYCPTTIEQGEDNGLIVAQTKFDCQIRADKGPEKKTKWKYAGSDEWHEALVEGEFTSSSLPDIGSISDIEIGYSVTSIAASAFYECTSLKSATIPNSVTSIGSSAFESCTGLSSVDIPSSVTSLEDRVFRSCTGLTSVTIPDSVTSIGVGVFFGCSHLTSMTIPDSVLSIGNAAFQNCTGLESVTIGNNVESIGTFAFYYCTSLESVTIPDSVETVGIWAFAGCTNLTSVTIGNNVESIGYAAFAGCSGLESVTIPGSVTSIGGSVFASCTGLESVTIGNGVTSIDESAFERCSGLSSIEFGDSVSSIGATAFTKCSSLVEATLPESIQSIGANAFSDCTSMTQLLFEGKTDRQVKAMENYSWGLSEGVARGAVIETFSINWYVADGTTSSVPGGYVAGATIRFDTDDSSKSLQFVSVNGVEISDTSVYGQSFYEYVVQEEDVFLQVTFAVPQAKAVFSFTGTNVSCDLPDGEYCVGMVVNLQALPLSNALSVEQTSMLSAMYVNGVFDLDVARSFGRPSLSADAWQYVLKEGENTVSASADLLPYCKDRTHYWVGYNSSNGVLSWRSCDRRDFVVAQNQKEIYITGPQRMPNYSGSDYPPKTFEWTTPYGDAVDWTDIEDVFVPCFIYNQWPGPPSYTEVAVAMAAFANMPSLRKVKFDCMRPSDPKWSTYGNRSHGIYAVYDSVQVRYNAVTDAFNGAALVFNNSPNLEEVDFSYDEGGVFWIKPLTRPQRFVNWFYNTKLKEFKIRLFCDIEAPSSGTIQNLYFTEYLNGIKNYDGTFKLVIDYTRVSDGYSSSLDSYALPIGNLSPVAATGTAPRYRPKIAEIHYPMMSNYQLAQTAGWTTPANRNICNTAATRALAGEGLSALIIPNWASNAAFGAGNFLNPSESLREVVLLSGTTVPTTTATWWPSRELTSMSQLSSATTPYNMPHVSVYVPDSLYTQFQTNAQWSQLSSKGYDLKPVSTWPRLNPGT